MISLSGVLSLISPARARAGFTWPAVPPQVKTILMALTSFFAPCGREGSFFPFIKGKGVGGESQLAFGAGIWRAAMLIYYECCFFVIRQFPAALTEPVQQQEWVGFLVGSVL